MEAEMEKALLRVLERELQLVGGLADSAREKERLLVCGDVRGFADLLEREEEAVLELREREAERAGRVSSLAPGESGGSPTLWELARRTTDPECGRRLASAGKDLAGLLRGLSRQNAKLKTLLKRRMDDTQFLLNLLYNQGGGIHFYNMQGGREEKSGFAGRLDCEA